MAYGRREHVGNLGRFVPWEIRKAGDYRLPKCKATKKQTQALESLAADYLRYKAIRQCLGLPSRVVAEALSISPSTAAKLIQAAEERGDEYKTIDTWLVCELLRGMDDGTYAGILGTRRTETSRFLFKLVSSFDQHHREFNGIPDREQVIVLLAAFHIDYKQWAEDDQ